MLKKYIGKNSPIDLKLAGEDFGQLDTGQKIAIDDELASQFLWSPRLWEDVVSEKPKAVKVKEPELNGNGEKE
jgi:hypothetical protein